MEDALKRNPSLEQVLTHYKQSGDTAKYNAAVFLLKNLHLHYSLNSENRQRFDHIFFKQLALIPDSIKSDTSFYESAYVNYLLDSLSTAGYYLNDLETLYDIDTITSNYLIENIDLSFEAYNNYSWSKPYDFQIFSEYILPYKSTSEPIEAWRSLLFNNYYWLEDSLKDISDPIEVCRIINTNLSFHTNIGFYNYTLAQPLSNMLTARVGSCQEFANIAIFSMRAQGLAVAYDYTPIWADFHLGHNWNALIDHDGKTIDFLGAYFNPGENVLKKKVSKIYRKTYSVQQNSLAIINNDKEPIPDLFNDVHFIDVTKEYFPVIDITSMIETDLANLTSYAYICTFGDREWTPIHWGVIEKNKSVTFTDLGMDKPRIGYSSLTKNDNKVIGKGRGIVYAPSIFFNKQLQIVDYPFILTSSAVVHQLKPDTTNKNDIKLDRKFPLTERKTNWAKSFQGGKFQGANDISFRNAVDLYIIQKTPSQNYELISLRNNESFSYIRYLAPNNSRVHIAELEFFSINGDEIAGAEIGTSGGVGSDFHKAFDKNPLTYYVNSSLKQNWIGLKLDKRNSIKEIRYLIRNDGNSIQKGDAYELLFASKDGWKSLGIQKADTTFLIYQKTPSNALFWLRNLSRGKEERIFTYENGQQIWW
ncbi:MAG: hypothetical protein RIG77_05965 [Cyclobacteriaceae bacterium]